MGTWKRPLPDGVACEDQRVAYNPTLGQGKAGAAKLVAKPVEVAAEVEVEAPEPVEVEAPVEVEVPVANPMKVEKAPKKAKDVEPEVEAAE